jgi:hypothetical protein
MTAETWKAFFTAWPKDVQHRGVVVNTLNEAIPFKSFMIKNDMLLLDRTNPDPMGSRFILLGFDSVHNVKLIDPIKESVLAAAGFAGKLA